MFTIDTVKHLPPSANRRTADIGTAAPCGACSIRHAAVHSKISDEDLNRLVAIATTVDLRPGQTLFTEGDPAKVLFTIARGDLMVYKMTSDGRRQVTGFLFRGDFLGLTLDGRYAYSAEAITQCSLYRYPILKVQELVRRYPDMERRLCRITRQELVEAQEQMLLLGRKSARERVASFLLKLVRQSADRGHRDAEIFLPMTRAMIGDYVGLTTETVSRALTEFRRDGLLSETGDHKIRLPNVAYMEEIAEGLE
jgi:CRP/FNR family transcriptional regulator